MGNKGKKKNRFNLAELKGKQWLQESRKFQSEK